MVIYEPILIKYTEEQLKRRRDFIQKYTNNKEFRDLINRISQDAEEQTNKTFRRRNDKKIRGKRNISYKRLEKFLRAFQIVLKEYLLKNKELMFKNFVKLGPRIAKDRIVTTASYIGRDDLKPKKIHMPQHLRFKASFCQDFKNYLNKD